MNIDTNREGGKQEADKTGSKKRRFSAEHGGGTENPDQKNDDKVVPGVQFCTPHLFVLRCLLNYSGTKGR